MSFDYGKYFGEIKQTHDLLTKEEDRSWLLKAPRDGERHDVVLYGASWCGACKRQLPALRRLHERFADRGLTVLGLSLDDEPAHGALQGADGSRGGPG